MNAIVSPFHQPLQVKTLADKAVLVRLSCSMWSPYAYDKTATQQIEQTAGVAKAGRYNKHLMKNSAPFKRVQSAYSAVYTHIRDNTSPGSTMGSRMLRADYYIDVTAEARRLIMLADDAVRDLEQVWTSEVQKDMLRLNGMANISDYPADIAAQFSISLRFLPVPSTGDFRVGLDPDDIASLQGEIEAAEKRAGKYVLEQMLEPLQAAVARLGEYTGDKGQRFHDSTLTNILEVATRMERVNLSEDPTVAAAIRQLKQAAQSIVLNASAVKEDAQVRANVQARVQQLADQFAGLV